MTMNAGFKVQRNGYAKLSITILGKLPSSQAQRAVEYNRQ